MSFTKLKKRHYMDANQNHVTNSKTPRHGLLHKDRNTWVGWTRYHAKLKKNKIKNIFVQGVLTHGTPFSCKNKTCKNELIRTTSRALKRHNHFHANIAFSRTFMLILQRQPSRFEDKRTHPHGTSTRHHAKLLPTKPFSYTNSWQAKHTHYAKHSHISPSCRPCFTIM